VFLHEDVNSKKKELWQLDSASIPQCYCYSVSMLEIPTQPGIPHCTQQTELDGKSYTLEFEFIESEGFWMLHIGDQDGNPLVCGIKLVADWPLLRRDAGVMGGNLLALDSLKILYFVQ
jgi:hypothetical protein